MTIRDWLIRATAKLDTSNIPSSSLDAELLLSDLLMKDRSWIHAHDDQVLLDSQLQSLNKQISLRSTHTPIAYIRRKQEFYGREFIVSPETLTPRPETETMIDLLIKHIEKQKFKHNEKVQIADIGTGSGCIIITAALEFSSKVDIQCKLSLFGLDVSESALKIARKNAIKLSAKVDFKNFDLHKDNLNSLAPTLNTSIFLANLPYVPDDFHINLAATHEPSFAIFGGKDGLDHYRKLFEQVNNSGLDERKSSCTVFTESLPPQHEELSTIAAASGFALIASQDFIQVFSRD